MAPTPGTRPAASGSGIDVFSGAGVNLDAYFERIGFGAERTDTLDALRAILALHPQAIPFENLNPLLGWPVPLEVDALQQKLVRDGRGGYCFEHNLLLGHVLTALGFRVTGLAARVVMHLPPGAVNPRTHMLLLVDLDGHPHLADAGFGGLTLTGPLRLETDTEQATPHEPFRIMRDEAGLRLEAKLRGEWTSLYRFDLQPCVAADYEVANWYVSTSPRSHFVTTLVAARARADRRYALRNHELAVHSLDGETRREALTSVAAVRDALADLFGIAVPGGAEAAAAFARILPR